MRTSRGEDKPVASSPFSPGPLPPRARGVPADDMGAALNRLTRQRAPYTPALAPIRDAIRSDARRSSLAHQGTCEGGSCAGGSWFVNRTLKRAGAFGYRFRQYTVPGPRDRDGPSKSKRAGSMGPFFRALSEITGGGQKLPF